MVTAFVDVMLRGTALQACTCTDYPLLACEPPACRRILGHYIFITVTCRVPQSMVPSRREQGSTGALRGQAAAAWPVALDTQTVALSSHLLLPAMAPVLLCLPRRRCATLQLKEGMDALVRLLAHA